MRKNLPVQAIEDPAALECVESLVDELADQVLGNFRGRFITLDLITGTHEIPHRLRFTPRDVIQTSVRGGSFTWNFADFSQTHINVTCASVLPARSVVVRAFVGRYVEE